MILDRTTFIGASDVPAVMGVSPWTTPWAMWAQKTGALPPHPDNVAMTAGRIVESAIVNAVAEREGINIRWRNHRLTHPWLKFFSAEPDAIATVNDRSDCVLIETKNVGHAHARDWGDEPPIYVWLQVQAQLACAGQSEARIGALIRGNEFRVYRVDADPVAIATIEKAVDEFWRMVIDRTPPKIDADDDEGIAWANAERWRTGKPGTESSPHSATPELDALLTDAVGAQKLAAAAEKNYKALTTRIKAIVGPGYTAGTTATALISTPKAGVNKDKCWDAAVAQGLIPAATAKEIETKFPAKNSPRLTIKASKEDEDERDE